MKEFELSQSITYSDFQKDFQIQKSASLTTLGLLGIKQRSPQPPTVWKIQTKKPKLLTRASQSSVPSEYERNNPKLKRASFIQQLLVKASSGVDLFGPLTRSQSQLPPQIAPQPPKEPKEKSFNVVIDRKHWYQFDHHNLVESFSIENIQRRNEYEVQVLSPNEKVEVVLSSPSIQLLEAFLKEFNQVPIKLETMLKVFMKPMLSLCLSFGLSQEQVYKMFGGEKSLEDLIDKHHLLLTEMDTWPEKLESTHFLEREISLSNLIETHLLEWLESTYAPYFSGFQDAKQILNQQRKNTGFISFLKTTESLKTLNRLDIQSFLILPIQRVPRYSLLLHTILKGMPVGHFDHWPLKRTIEALDGKIKKLDQLVSQQKEKEKKTKQRNSKAQDDESVPSHPSQSVPSFQFHLSSASAPATSDYKPISESIPNLSHSFQNSFLLSASQSLASSSHSLSTDHDDKPIKGNKLKKKNTSNLKLSASQDKLKALSASSAQVYDKAPLDIESLLQLSGEPEDILEEARHSEGHLPSVGAISTPLGKSLSQLSGKKLHWPQKKT